MAWRVERTNGFWLLCSAALQTPEQLRANMWGLTNIILTETRKIFEGDCKQKNAPGTHWPLDNV